MVPTLLFKEQIAVASSYLSSRQNPKDGGWGLNIERPYQSSSIVNTAEALYTLRRAPSMIANISSAIDYLRAAVHEHPAKRGDNVRYYTFGAMGLVEAGCPSMDPDLQFCVAAIHERYAADQRGWPETPGEANTRLWSTFTCLSVLASALGKDAVRTQYEPAMAQLINLGKASDFRWSFSPEDKTVSLAATAYASILLSMLYPGAPETTRAYDSVQCLLDVFLTTGQMIEVESIPGTDWHHYSLCWALKALADSPALFERKTYRLLSSILQHLASSFIPEKGFLEPGKQLCNVRSIYNNVVALHAVVERFDPYWLVDVDRCVRAVSSPLGGDHTVDQQGASEDTRPAEDADTRSNIYLTALSGASPEIERVKILRSLSGGYSGAVLDLCEVWHKHGVPGLYQVFKVMDDADATQEAKGGAIASEFLPAEYRVDLYGKHPLGSTNRTVLRYRYAGATLSVGNIMPLLEYFESLLEPSEANLVMAELFGKALGGIYARPEGTTVSLRQLRDIFDERRSGRFWSSIMEGMSDLRARTATVLDFPDRERMLLRFPYRTVFYCFGDTGGMQKAWEDLFPIQFTNYSHGDLNPRNVLMVRSEKGFRPVLIDFHRFRACAPFYGFCST